LYIQTISDTKAFKMDVLQSKKMNKIHISYILQLSMITLALFIITTSQVKAQQGQDSHGLTPEQVKQFCRSDNPRLSFVNHTESEICGLPESTPSTPASNSSGSSSGSSPSSSGSSPSSSGSSPSSSGSITPQAP
jgi:hypothetical protein